MDTARYQLGQYNRAVSGVPTKDRTASLQLATHPLVKKLSFTGSTAVGCMLSKLAAGTMKKVSMELGGNAPFIVFDDADLDLAVEGALPCKFRCAGQVCVVSHHSKIQRLSTCLTSLQSANRLIVHESLVDTFADKLSRKVQQLKLGRGVDPETTIGPLVNKKAVQTVSNIVTDAISKGARLHTGGKAADRHGFFFEPAVLTGATVDMDVAHDEIFGPVAAIFSFQTEEQALALANDTEFGLAGYFYSRDIGRIMRVAGRLECGMVGVNTILISGAENPFSGIKESGLGTEGSKYGLGEYQNIKAVTIGNLDH